MMAWRVILLASVRIVVEHEKIHRQTKIQPSLTHGQVFARLPAVRRRYVVLIGANYAQINIKLLIFLFCLFQFTRSKLCKPQTFVKMAVFQDKQTKRATANDGAVDTICLWFNHLITAACLLVVFYFVVYFFRPPRMGMTPSMKSTSQQMKHRYQSHLIFGQTFYCVVFTFRELGPLLQIELIRL